MGGGLISLHNRRVKVYRKLIKDGICTKCRKRKAKEGIKFCSKCSKRK